MKKINRAGLIVWLIFFVIYNVLVFLLFKQPFTKTFWIAYGFTTFAFLIQIPIAIIAFRKDTTPKSAFLGLPITNVGWIYLILQLLWGFIAMAFPVITPAWATALSAILAGFALAAVVLTHTAGGLIESKDQVIAEKTSFVKVNQVIIENLISSTDDEQIKHSLTDLRDLVRYSDPISHPSLATTEMDISNRITNLVSTINSGNVTKAKNEVKLINELLSNRNRTLKILK